MVNRKNKILPSFIPEKVIIHSKQTLGRPSDIMVNVGDMVKEGEVLAKPKDLISSYVHSSIPGRIEDIMDSGKDYKKIKIKYEGTLESLNKQPETINSLSDEDILSRIEKAGIIESYDNNIPIFYLISLSRLNNIKSVYIDATTKEDRPFLNDYLLSTKKKEIQLVIEILKKVFKSSKITIIGNYKNIFNGLLNYNKKVNIKYHTSMKTNTVKKLKLKYNRNKIMYKSIDCLSKESYIISLESLIQIYEAVLLNKPFTDKIITIHKDNHLYNIKVKIGMIIYDLLRDLNIDIKDKAVFIKNKNKYKKLNDLYHPITKEIKVLLIDNI